MAAEAPPPHLPNIQCPFQETLENVPIVVCDISQGFEGYFDCMRRKKRRELDISPFHVNGGDHNIPVTPLRNPLTGLSSHHIIRIINGLTGRFRVDLFVRDSDQYFLAFRREVVLSEEEIEQGQIGGWGRWQKLKNAPVPDFLNARDTGIEFSSPDEKDKVTPGGFAALEDIYYTFGRFEDDGVAGCDIQRVSFRVMSMFCETTRLRSVWLEVCRRIRNGSSPATLSGRLWGNIKNWARLGVVVLTARVNNLLGLELELPAWCQQEHGFNRMNDLIGPRGEIMLINHHKDWLGLTARQLLELENIIAGNVQEPNFK